MGMAKTTDLAHARLILVAMDGSPEMDVMDVTVVTGGSLEESLEESQEWVATPETLTTGTGAQKAETRTSEMTRGSHPTGDTCCSEDYLESETFKVLL